MQPKRSPVPLDSHLSEEAALAALPYVGTGAERPQEPSGGNLQAGDVAFPLDDLSGDTQPFFPAVLPDGPFVIFNAGQQPGTDDWYYDGPFDPDDFSTMDNGVSFTSNSGGGHPTYLRVTRQSGNVVTALSADGTPMQLGFAKIPEDQMGSDPTTIQPEDQPA